MDIGYFKSAAEFRDWLEGNHARFPELYVGFYKKGTGRESITYPEALDQALCFGWIDGVRKSLDNESYTIRFTPRGPCSVWSAVNLKRFEELVAAGVVDPSGMRALRDRNRDKVASSAYREEIHRLDEGLEAEFRRRPRAWSFFQVQPDHYRKNASRWIMTAKKEETRLKRLAELIDLSARGEQHTWGFKKKP